MNNLLVRRLLPSPAAGLVKRLTNPPTLPRTRPACRSPHSTSVAAAMAAAMEVDGPALPDINATGSYATFLPYNADGALNREAAAYLDEISDGLAQSVLDNDPAGIVHGVKSLSRYAPRPWPRLPPRPARPCR